ncbi:MAG: hypothetical protein RQ729_03865 [Wenzhouxiangellaceae bacterium]|nr:hypothetical protein [Wenzhouxiangellaceae bacterium]
MSRDALMDDVRLWRELGWIRLLDEQFADFLASLDPKAADALLLAAAMTSHQLGKGHVCLSLDLWLAEPGPDSTADALRALELPPEDSGVEDIDDPGLAHRRARGLERLQARFAALDRAALAQALAQSPLVADGSDAVEGTPLVFDRGRLYLRRNWRAETGIAAAIVARIAERINGQVSSPEPEQIGAAVRRIFIRRRR